MPFERYLGRRLSMREPQASLWKTGQINLNRPFLEKFEAEKYAHAILFYDEEKKKIAFRLVSNDKEPGTITLSKKAGGVIIHAMGFLKYFGIERGKARHFAVRRDDKQDLFILDEK